jgi:hypothetical protein
MPRAKWTPPNADVEKRIRHVVRLKAELDRIQARYDEAEAKYKAALTALVDPAKDDVPVAYMAETLNVERKTIYRHTGRPMQ